MSSAWITLIAQKSGFAIRTLEEYSLNTRVLNALNAYAVYLYKTFWPFNLTVFYPHPGLTVKPLSATIGLIIILFMTIYTIRNSRLFPFLTIGWLWYLITLIPVIGLVQVGEQAYADRYMYLPSIGLFIAIVWGAEIWIKKSNPVKTSMFLISLLMILISLSYKQTGYWYNQLTLYEHVLEIDPKNVLANNNYSESLYDQGKTLTRLKQYNKAINFFKEALSVHPSMGKAENSWGNTLSLQKKYKEAIPHYNHAIKLQPHNANFYKNLGVTFLRLGDIDNAENQFLISLSYQPSQAEAHNNLGLILFLKGALNKAVLHYQLALKASPKEAGIHYNLSKALDGLGKKRKSAYHLQRALKLNPSLKKPNDFLTIKNTDLYKKTWK